MKIAIDANDIIHGERAIRRYALNLVKGLAQLGRTHEYELCYFKFRKPEHKLADLTGGQSKERSLFFPARIIRYAWQHFSWPSAEILYGDADIIHCPGLIIPGKTKMPLLLTIHSTAHINVPEKLENDYRIWYENFLSWAVKQAHYFITVSEVDKKSICETYQIETSRVRAIPLGVGKEFRPRKREEILPILKKTWNLDRPYLLYVGGLQKNKNIDMLFRAFDLVKEQGHPDLMLVLVGAVPKGGEKYWSELEPRVKKGDIVLTGYLESESPYLPVIYSGAKVFIFPTFWEGFASPPLEAMASGVPAVVSLLPALQENCGDAPIYVNPHDPVQMAHAIGQFLNDREMAEEYRKKGLVQAGRYEWAQTARLTCDYYEEIGRLGRS